MAKNLFLFFLLSFFFKLGFSINTDRINHILFLNPNDSSRFQEVYINSLKQLNPSLTGKTSHGNNYQIFAIKRSKGWNYLILDSTSYYSFWQEVSRKSNPSQKAELIENSDSYTNMLCMAAQAKALKKIAKPKNVSGLTFSCYYKFRPRAKKMYRSYVKVQGKAKFFETNLQNGAAGKTKILKSLMK